MGPVEKCLRDSGLDTNNVHGVVLVGGSNRIPKVQATIQEFFNGKGRTAPSARMRRLHSVRPCRQQSSLVRGLRGHFRY